MKNFGEFQLIVHLEWLSIWCAYTFSKKNTPRLGLILGSTLAQKTPWKKNEQLELQQKKTPQLNPEKILEI